MNEQDKQAKEALQQKIEEISDSQLLWLVYDFVTALLSPNGCEKGK